MSANKDQKKQETSGKQQVFEVPVEGSLGLLALGAVGLIAWRKKREENNKTMGMSEKKEK